MTRLAFTEQTLGALLPGIVPAALAERCVSAVTDDSRQVEPGCVFVARAGVRFDAEHFVEDARAKGAVAILTEVAGEGADRIVVEDLSEAVVSLVCAARGLNLAAIKLIGITGTNGKTSVSNFIASALTQAGHQPVGIIGTLGAGVWSASLEGLAPVFNTTPGQLELLGRLADFQAAGARYVVLEVSSHAMDQGRLNGIPVHVAVFTNLSRDHLDYHGDMDRYFDAKARLFERDELEAVIVNYDSPRALELLERVQANPASNPECWAYGLGDPDWVVDDCQLVQARQVAATGHGLDMQLATPLGDVSASVALAGLFNASNLMAAVSVLLALGMPLDAVREAMGQMQAPPGRMQAIDVLGAPRVVVDYAHTPDALDQALRALRDHLSGEARLICVFGCGGDRDAGKRPLMGQVAERLADLVILTDDNPRSESPETIIAGILSGVADRDAVLVEHDRAKAIANAIRLGHRQDWVLIAGKGHETWQEIAGEKIPFSDVDVARRCLQEVLS